VTGTRKLRTDLLVLNSRLDAAHDPVAHITATVGKALRRVVDGGADPKHVSLRTSEAPGGLLITAEGTAPARVEPTA